MAGIIYVLKLEHHKYYVGKTKNMSKRYQEHIDGTGSEWTNIFKPIKILEAFENIGFCSEFFEDINTFHHGAAVRIGQLDDLPADH